MKIVINNQYGGFSLSAEAIEEYLKLKGKKVYFYELDIRGEELRYRKTSKGENEPFVTCFTKDFGAEIAQDSISDEEWEKYMFDTKEIQRTDKDLIEVIKKLGEKANTMCSSLKIIEIPDDVDWVIEEYDGAEWVAERHRTWG